MGVATRMIFFPYQSREKSISVGVGGIKNVSGGYSASTEFGKVGPEALHSRYTIIVLCHDQTPLILSVSMIFIATCNQMYIMDFSLDLDVLLHGLRNMHCLLLGS